MSNKDSNTPEILLFFHPNSKACIKLRDIVSNSKKNKNIKFINIDEIITIPSNIKSIPSLIINNNKILSGKEVFDYFNGNNEEFEFMGFQSKINNTLSNFYSDLNNEEQEINSNNISSSSYASIDAPNINEGIPSYTEEDNSSVKLEDITSRRAHLEKELGFDSKPKNQLE
jgi:hypothetical protein